MTKSTSTLKTERLCLRQLKPTDAKAMYQNWASDPAVTTYLTWQPHQDLNVTRASLVWRQEQYHKENYFD
ncbi:hypothetical protein LFYK43_23150 [Ligilactobacillus salitolerans]|uniref:N-acetyltransferase domain-containing protein n=1 Tax=Ligilactobacillus salitolerans TaxID=1808352 RepID=A0A401IWH2_9LACO|nr:hypothetical protein LFYK43_23150 [Ligilactobacillus salitolerans]